MTAKQNLNLKLLLFIENPLEHIGNVKRNWMRERKRKRE
jgi:hypothetical protein